MISRLIRGWIEVAQVREPERSAPGFHFPWWIWGIYAILLTTIATINSTSFWFEAARMGTSVPLPQLAIEEASSVVLVIAITPLLVFWTALLRPDQIGWRMTLAGHLAGMVVFFLLHIAGMNLLRFGVFSIAAELGHFRPNSIILIMIYEGRKDALTYIALAAGSWILAVALRKPPIIVQRTAISIHDDL